MRRYLVVANQTLAGPHLVDRIRSCLAAGPASFHVVVPATPPQDQAVWTEGEANALAEARLDHALSRFRSLGAVADGEVGDAQPLEAIRDALRETAYDEVILSTLPPGLSKWLKLDLPTRVAKAFGVPVTHLVADAEPGSRSA